MTELPQELVLWVKLLDANLGTFLLLRATATDVCFPTWTYTDNLVEAYNTATSRASGPCYLNRFKLTYIPL